MRRYLLVAIVAGCGRIGFDASGGDGSTDAMDGGSDVTNVPGCANGVGPWGAPQPLASINTARTEWSPSLTADTLDLAIEVQVSGGTDLFEATRPDVDSPFSAPIALSSINSGASDTDPWLSPDGLTMYFSSQRTTTFSTVYRTTRISRADPWSVPQQIPELSADSVHGVTLSVDGTEMFYTYEPATQLYRATQSGGTWTKVGLVTGLPQDAGYASLSADGLTLYFQAQGANKDIYVATRDSVGGDFHPAQAVAEANSTYNENDPEISKDGLHLLFASDRPGGAGLFDMYEMTRSCN